jgi:hypothetical protein
MNQPPEYARRIAFDIGASVNAPMTEIWLSKDPELYVYIVEPNPYNVIGIKQNSTDPITLREKTFTPPRWPIHLDPKRLETSCEIIHAALHDNEDMEVEFYCNGWDSGTSSLYKPVDERIEVFDVVTVQAYKFTKLLNQVDWDRFECIWDVKIDAQSADFDIVKSADYYIEKFRVLQVEIGTNGQYEHEEDPQGMRQYIKDAGFYELSWGPDGNGVFLNQRYREWRIFE